MSSDTLDETKRTSKRQRTYVVGSTATTVEFATLSWCRSWAGNVPSSR